uniref:HTH OST-type domain-containing protein n=1 Tax=Anopheles christyi TaxID=43041 RepID=A0A182JWN2_9DIPT
MDEIKTIIRALAISNASNGITVAQLNKDFKNLEGYSIPYGQFGFYSLDVMLRTMTDALRVSGYGMTAIVQPLSNEKSQHVREMVKRNKNTSKKPIQNNHTTRKVSPAKGYDKNDETTHGTQFTHFASYNGIQKQQPACVDLHKFQQDIREELRRAERQNNALKAIQNIDGPKQQTFKGREEQRKSVTVDNPKMSPSHAKIDQSNTLSEIISMSSLKVDYTLTNGVTVPMSGKTALKQKYECANLAFVQSSIPADAMTAKEMVAATKLPPHLQPKTVFKAVVTAALNPKHLHVHLMEHTDKLLSLAPYIDTLYRTKASGDEWLMPEGMVQVGLYCAAKYYNRWYRAKIMSELNHRRVLLLYIDYGYLRYVSLPNVRFLARELASIPPQVLQVSLEYLKPARDTWSGASCEHFATLVHRKVLDMIIINTKQDESTLDVILTSSLNSSIDSLIRNSHEGTLNKQLALHSDILWLS